MWSPSLLQINLYYKLYHVKENFIWKTKKKKEKKKKRKKYIPFALTLSLDELQEWPNGNPEKKRFTLSKILIEGTSSQTKVSENPYKLVTVWVKRFARLKILFQHINKRYYLEIN